MFFYPPLSSERPRIMNDLKTAVDHFFPTKSVLIRDADIPWMTSLIKQLIPDRQRAYRTGNKELWKHLRNKVCKVIFQRKEAFCKENVHHLWSSNPRKWGNIINKMSNRSSGATSISYEDENGNVISGPGLATRLNKFHISVASDLSPLDTNLLPAYLPSEYELPVIRSTKVCRRLLEVNPFKSMKPDKVPNRIEKNFSLELAKPVTKILNTSFSTGTFPMLWKDSYLSPILKVAPVTCDGDLRPIAFTPCIAKV